MNRFVVNAPFQLAGDQNQATEAIVEGLSSGSRFQTLKGVTGSGKTFTMAKIVEALQRPTLVLSHNKTLAAQLFREFTDFFPDNSVEYFVSYYDYYQPEAYVASRDLYIEKDASINDEIERMRLSATTSLVERRDTIVVATVSCIYGLGIHVILGKCVSRVDWAIHSTCENFYADWLRCNTNATTLCWTEPNSGLEGMFWKYSLRIQSRRYASNFLVMR